MGTEKIIESDLEEGSGVSGRKPSERRPAGGEAPGSPVHPGERVTVEFQDEPEGPQQPRTSGKKGKSGKNGFGRISFDKKSDYDIFSD